MAQITQKQGLIQNYNSDLAKLIVKGTEAQVKRHAELSTFAQAIRSQIQAYTNQRRTFVAMQDEVASTRATKAPELLRQAQARHGHSGLNDQQWGEFLLIYKGSVDDSLVKYLAWADKKIAELNGQSLQTGDPNTPLIADEVDLKTLNLSTIVAEMTRLEAKLADAQGAAARKKVLQAERDNAYKRVFEAIINEQNALAELYAPLMVRLASTTGTLSKLGFSVRRIVNVEQWGSFAEKNLLDLRKAGPFTGRGTLTAHAERMLKHAWEVGTAAEIQVAMTGFISTYLGDMLAHAPFAPTQQAEYQNWLKRFAHWLFGTEHISVRYEIGYDGIDIRKLSPGTRGIVLLLLYLALDESDDRPLVIDQPEENLDPKSVNDELVPLFIAAKA